MLTRLTVMCAGGSGTFGGARPFGASKLRVRITGLVKQRVQAAHEAAPRWAIEAGWWAIEDAASAKRMAMVSLPPHLVSLPVHACQMCCNRWRRGGARGWTTPRTRCPAAAPVRACAGERRLTGCCSVAFFFGERGSSFRRGVPELWSARAGHIRRAGRIGRAGGRPAGRDQPLWSSR
jgi:hypothetical protein